MTKTKRKPNRITKMMTVNFDADTKKRLDTLAKDHAGNRSACLRALVLAAWKIIAK